MSRAAFNTFVLTFDVDWAPDCMLRPIAHRLADAGVKATWFVTHDSPAVRELMDNPLFEIGIHPNFLPRSSHGKTMEEVLETLLAIAPAAISARSHGVVQSGALLNYYVKHTAIRIDSTTFLPGMPNIAPLLHALPDGELWRIPFFWADDYEMCQRNKCWSIDHHLNVHGLKVMTFHPVHLWLNCPDLDFYANAKSRLSSCPPLTGDEQCSWRHQGDGAETFFSQLVQHLADKKTRRLCDLLL